VGFEPKISAGERPQAYLNTVSRNSPEETEENPV